MGTRHKARERALQALYQMDVAGIEPGAALDAALRSSEEIADSETLGFAQELVLGAAKHREEIDQVIEKHSHHWRVDRMAKVDRNVLRLAIYELLFRADVPKKVVLNEAIELGKQFGSEESSSFINGILDKVARTVERE